MSEYHVYNAFFKEFKEFHDIKYKSQKGENVIWLEFYTLIFLYTMLVVSFCLVSFSDPGGVPDDSVWKIKIQDDMPDQIKVEVYMSALNRREEILNNNRNLISEENLNESRSTASKIFNFYFK